MRLQEDKKKFVVGGKVWTHFNVRCPLCSKLYRVDSRDLASSEPHFDCRVCTGVFSFQNPPGNINKVDCKIISAGKTGQIDEKTILENSSHFKRCPKCKTLNARSMEECQRCHVILAKAHAPGVESPGVESISSGLARAWKDIFRDYNNLSKHLAFVDQCEDLSALPFAMKKYQALKDAQPQDTIVAHMLQRLKVKEMAEKVEHSATVQRMSPLVQRINFARMRRMAPWTGALLMILIGGIYRGQRNFIGLGVAILFLWVGLKLFHKGKISVSDFY